MIHLFKKRNGAIITVSGASAWSMYTAPNNFITHKPQYLGVITPQTMRDIKDEVKEAFPITDELIDEVNSGERKAHRELRRISKEREKLNTELLIKAAEEADKSLTPQNYDRLAASVDGAAQGDLSGVLKNYQR